MTVTSTTMMPSHQDWEGGRSIAADREGGVENPARLAGHLSENREPKPGLLSTESVSPIPSASFLATLKPRPKPGTKLSCFQKRSKTCFCPSLSIPIPVSPTINSTTSSLRWYMMLKKIIPLLVNLTELLIS